MPKSTPRKTNESTSVVFRSSGEVSARCREKDWGATALGPVGTWPGALKAAAEIVVASPSPMSLLWGPELVQIYSEGYREILGDKHPRGLGQTVRECWPEVWHQNAPFYESVLKRSEAHEIRGQRLMIRRSGRPVEIVVDLACSPVFAAGEKVAGVLVCVCECTPQVRARELLRATRRSASALRESEARYRTLAELSPVATLIIAGGRYAYANPEALRLFGARHPEQILGISPFDFVAPDDHARARERVRRVIEEKRTAPSMEARMIRLDGSSVLVEVSAGYVRWDGVHAALVVMRDITERKHSEEVLRVAKEAAEEASLAKTRFLSTMSHELRTPLNAVIGLSDLMVNGVVGPVNPVQKDNLVRIKSSAWYLVELIEEILGFTRAETGGEEAHLGDVDLAEISRSVLAMLAHSAAARGLTLRSSGLERPVMVRTDERKVRQIVTNLVANALKYTSSGGVNLELRLTKDAAEIRVRDSGPGIPPERLEDIFDPFVQVDSPTVRAGGGTGLGLAISRRLAALLEGEITVDSVLGEGSTFTLRLPRR